MKKKFRFWAGLYTLIGGILTFWQHAYPYNASVGETLFAVSLSILTWPAWSIVMLAKYLLG